MPPYGSISEKRQNPGRFYQIHRETGLSGAIIRLAIGPSGGMEQNIAVMMIKEAV
jgi:hypothetical protein